MLNFIVPLTIYKLAGLFNWYGRIMENYIQGIAAQNGDLLDLLQRVSIALMIGLLIGIERERRKQKGERTFAGIRTFPLISLLGFLAALTASFTSIAVYISVIAVFGFIVGISYYFVAGKGEIGGTTEMSYLIVFVLGSLVYWGFLLLPSIITVVIIILLTLKNEFHSFVKKIDDEDIYAACT